MLNNWFLRSWVTSINKWIPSFLLHLPFGIVIIIYEFIDKLINFIHSFLGIFIFCWWSYFRLLCFIWLSMILNVLHIPFSLRFNLFAITFNINNFSTNRANSDTHFPINLYLIDICGFMKILTIYVPHFVK